VRSLFHRRPLSNANSLPSMDAEAQQGPNVLTQGEGASTETTKANKRTDLTTRQRPQRAKRLARNVTLNGQQQLERAVYALLKCRVTPARVPDQERPPPCDIFLSFSPRHVQVHYPEISDFVRCAPPNIPIDIIARIASFLNRMVEDDTPASLHKISVDLHNADALLDALVEVPPHDPRIRCYAHVPSQHRLRALAYDPAVFPSCLTNHSGTSHLRIGDVIGFDTCFESNQTHASAKEFILRGFFNYFFVGHSHVLIEGRQSYFCASIPAVPIQIACHFSDVLSKYKTLTWDVHTQPTAQGFPGGIAIAAHDVFVKNMFQLALQSSHSAVQKKILEQQVDSWCYLVTSDNDLFISFSPTVYAHGADQNSEHAESSPPQHMDWHRFSCETQGHEVLSFYDKMIKSPRMDVSVHVQFRFTVPSQNLGYFIYNHFSRTCNLSMSPEYLFCGSDDSVLGTQSYSESFLWSIPQAEEETFQQCVTAFFQSQVKDPTNEQVEVRFTVMDLHKRLRYEEGPHWY